MNYESKVEEIERIMNAKLQIKNAVTMVLQNAHMEDDYHRKQTIKEMLDGYAWKVYDVLSDVEAEIDQYFD